MKPGGKIYFVLALHNHQPVGNLPDVFKVSFERTYEPFIAVLERYPRIKIALHYSGSLLEWLEEHQPGFIQRLQKLAARGQVEMMGGGYYEPILPAIPDEDKIGQITMLSDRLRELFGAPPEGMWLAERVWEPHLARPIAAAGLRYVPVDDTHFHDAGYHELDHYYRTEEEGAPLDIFPISEELRYRVPFKPAREAIDFLRDHLDDAKQRLIVLADDGEKFGGWPGTYEAVYEKGWLEEFFSLLEENSGWLRTVTFREYRALFPPAGPVYLPTGSYREMKEWSGGFWRNFFARYPESNRMHKKMLAVRRRLKRLPAEGETFAQAQKLLWASQCNCAYWHGVFGGLYLNFLRAAVWQNLLRAEKLIDDALQKPPYLAVAAEDRCFNGEPEIAVSTDRLSLLFDPQLGGSLWELSWRPGAVNFLDTITRRPEAYHKEYLEKAASPAPPAGETESIHHLRAIKEDGLLDQLQYDPYPRGALIEHFLEKTVTLEEFKKGNHRERGDFPLQPATAVLERLPASEHRGRGGLRAAFRRIVQVDGENPVLLEKAITVFAGDDGFSVSYNLENRGGRTVDLSFAVELNLAFLNGYEDGRYYDIPGRDFKERHLASVGTEKEVERVSLVDRWRNVSLTLAFDQPALLWRMPVETISLSEAGLERSYQQSLLLARWDFALEAGESRAVGFTLDCAVAEKGSPAEFVGAQHTAPAGKP